MRVQVTLMGGLGKLGGSRPWFVEVAEGSSLLGLIQHLDSLATSPISTAILVNGERISAAYTVLRNGSNVLLARGLETNLAEGDEIVVLPKVAGGRS